MSPKCRKCGKEIVFDVSIWNGSKCTEIRYKQCSHCSDKRELDTKPRKYDANIIKKIEETKIKEWYPTNKLYYEDGRPFKKKEHYESIDQLYTKRNLQALAWLMKTIEEEPNKELRDFLKIAFTSMVHLCSKMVPAIQPTPGSHQTSYSSTWTQHSYWSAGKFMEQNVWNKFKSAINGHQGLMKAKEESNKLLKDVKFARSINQIFSGNADIYIYNGDCINLMSTLPKDSIDYIFTDPPYDASIQFGELSYMWVTWLKMDAGYLDKLSACEVVRNENQHKDFNTYNSLLSNSFQEMIRALKPEHYLTLTFHNPTFKVRNATIRAGVFAGFEFEKIFHQPLGQKSAKSLLQPFGSAQGDFYLRFKKPSIQAVPIPQAFDEVRFSNIVIDTTKALLAERAEPTPYTLIINHIDPVLAKNGFFGSLQSGLDVHQVLKNQEGKEFVLLDAQRGSSKGKLWWFKNPKSIARLNEVPLTERVEQTVFRQLNKKGKVTFTEVWDAISTEFPNSLTSDSTSIKDALEIYARKVKGKGGYWLLKPEFRHRINQHSMIIRILALVGKKKGYDIWIGVREQQEPDPIEVYSDKKLKDYMTIKNLQIINADNLATVKNIDLLWIKNHYIKSLFEIESTTTMTSALLRGSNVNTNVPKYMVIPEEREKQFQNKKSSPLFQNYFDDQNWNLLYFDTIVKQYEKKTTKIDVETIVDIKGAEPPKQKKHFQRKLFT